MGLLLVSGYGRRPVLSLPGSSPKAGIGQPGSKNKGERNEYILPLFFAEWAAQLASGGWGSVLGIVGEIEQYRQAAAQVIESGYMRRDGHCRRCRYRNSK